MTAAIRKQGTVKERPLDRFSVSLLWAVVAVFLPLYPTNPDLSFLFCNMGILTTLTSMDCYEDWIQITGTRSALKSCQPLTGTWVTNMRLWAGQVNRVY